MLIHESKKITQVILPKEYALTLAELKKRIKEAQVKAVLSANKEMLILYWSIGKIVADKQEKNGWGTNVIERLADDLQNEFTGIGGFSRTNMFRMQAFYLAYEKVAQAVPLFENLPFFQIPWGHNILILRKLKNEDERLWYAQMTIEHGWSRNALENWINTDLYNRQGKAITNFTRTLPESQSPGAQQALKDPYTFQFLTLHDEYIEKDIEQQLINNVQKMLLELGKGFAFVGRQYHFKVGESDFYADLLFYHFRLRCFVVVELKAQKFEPSDLGQLNFYLSIVDDQLRQPEDKPTIGLLLCKNKDNFVAEYALRDINKPIGVAGYETEIIDKLPQDLKSSLPTIDEIEAELEKHEVLNDSVNLS